MYHVLKDLEPVQNNGHNSIYDKKMFVLCVAFWKNSFLKIPYLFDSPPWALIKFLDLESGRLFEAGCLLNFHHFQQV